MENENYFQTMFVDWASFHVTVHYYYNNCDYHLFCRTKIRRLNPNNNSKVVNPGIKNTGSLLIVTVREAGRSVGRGGRIEDIGGNASEPLRSYPIASSSPSEYDSRLCQPGVD